jgi:hypothetical protein
VAVFVYVFDDAVDIMFTGADRWLTFNPHGQLIAMDDVTGARVTSRAEARVNTGWRMPGTAWFWSLAAGWYTVKGRKGARELWCVYRDPEVLVIDTLLSRPCRIVLQHPDRHNLAWFIGERLGRR